MRLAAILIVTIMYAPSAAWAQSDTTVLFIGNSFTYGHGSPVRFYRADTVTDLNNTGIGGSRPCSSRSLPRPVWTMTCT